MKREHVFYNNGLPDPLYYFPLTENGNDSMGNFPGWTTNSVSSYTDDGAYFGGSNLMYKSSLGNTFSDIKTYSYKLKLPSLLSSVHTMVRIYSSSNAVINLYYAPSWNNDINFAVYYNGSYGAGSITSVPFVANETYVITVRQNQDASNTDLFVNGVKRSTAAKLIPASTSWNYLEIGCRETYDRYITGYVKDFIVFDTELTDEQIVMLNNMHYEKRRK